MKDKDKTKEQLINELGLLRQHSTELEAENTERKQAEEKLKLSEDKWRTLAENSPEQIMLMDLEGRIEYINYTIPGLTKEQVIGTSSYDYLPKESQQKQIDAFKRVIKT